MASGAPEEDGYNWKQTGHKLLKGREYPRRYYKCTHPNCEIKKQVERSGDILDIMYIGSHNHPKPPPNRRSRIGSSGTGLDMKLNGTEQTEQEGLDDTNGNIEWTSPVSAEFKYGSHSGSMQVRSGTQFGYGDGAADAFFKNEDENDRTSHMISYDREVEESELQRRKSEAYAAETSRSTRGSREPRVVVQITSPIDIPSDGYRWRKFGQKPIKGSSNPNPRSYYRCTYNGCAVKKHVQRDADNVSSVRSTYIGRHNHIVPAARNSRHVGSSGSGY